MTATYFYDNIVYLFSWKYLPFYLNYLHKTTHIKQSQQACLVVSLRKVVLQCAAARQCCQKYKFPPKKFLEENTTNPTEYNLHVLFKISWLVIKYL